MELGKADWSAGTTTKADIHARGRNYCDLYHSKVIILRQDESMTCVCLCRLHEAAVRQSREECWAREQELSALRDKLAALKTTLDDRRKDIVSYKVRKVARGSKDDRIGKAFSCTSTEF